VKYYICQKRRKVMSLLNAIQKVLPRPSSWRFVTSTGAQLSGSFGISAGAEKGAFFVKQDSDKGAYGLSFLAAGGGIGAGIKIPGNFLKSPSLSYSGAAMPGGGIGRIYLGPKQKSFTLDDFGGFVTIISIGGSAGAGADLSLVIFGNAGATIFTPLSAVTLFYPTLVLAIELSEAVGLLWSSKLEFLPNLTATIYGGWVSV
jgi:hypothetical protein